MNSLERAIRGRPGAESESVDRTSRFAETTSKRLRDTVRLAPTASMVSNSQPEAAEGGGSRTWPKELYPPTPDYNDFEDRLVLSEDLPCPEQYSYIRTGEIRTLYILSSKKRRGAYHRPFTEPRLPVTQ